MSGRGAGLCGGNSAGGYTSSPAGGRPGAGMGGGNRGSRMGRGMGQRFVGTGRRYNATGFTTANRPESNNSGLQQQMDKMQQQLNNITESIKNLLKK